MSFSKNVIWTFGARLAMVVNSVLAGIIVARWLGADGVGKLAVINVSVITLVQLGSLGLPSANTYFIAKDPNQFRRASLNSLLFAIIGGGLLAFGLMVITSSRPDWFGVVATDLFRIAAISIPFQLITLNGLNIFLAIGKIREFNLLDVVGQSFVLINSFLALLILHAGLHTLITLNAVASVLVSLVIVFMLGSAARRLEDADKTWRSDLILLKQMIGYGIKSHIAILAGTLIFRADLLVVNHFRNASEAGVYSLASQMATLLMMLPSVIATLLFPRVTAEQDKTGNTTCVVARHTALVMLLCCLAAVPLSLLLPVVYGSVFTDATTQLLILLPGVFFIGLQSVLVQHFNAMGLPKAVPVFWVVTLVINLMMVFLMVPRYGARGAAWASTISYSLISFLMIGYFLVNTRRSLSELFVLRPVEVRSLLGLALRSRSAVNT
ncbi:MAG TPA: flippase [Pyrinomonadaceae bacterium]|jgi:O-antigen/teichoic acid export membrane protein|nr:flippase [Pyrinomonadaceae bacterium]